MIEVHKLINARLDARDVEWWKSGVLYQIYPRSFSDASGDGVGDLRGLIERLPEIKTLGVDALWISPFFKSPMDDFGYDIEDHCDVDPLFGELSDASELIERAHALGIRILVDLVISHTSDQHEWFKASRRARDLPESDYYVWADPLSDGSPPNNWLSIFGGSAWKWDTRRRQYYLHNFLVSQPDLNFHHPKVREYALEVARFWLTLGVDGFRLDTVNFYFHDQALRSNPPATVRDHISAHESNPYGWQDHLHDKNRPEVKGFLRELRALLDEFPGRVALGEIGESPGRSLELLAEYTGSDSLHLCYSFDLLGPNGDAQYWRTVLERFKSKASAINPDSWPCWAFSNHDVMRAASRLCPEGGSSDATGQLLMALLLSLRGTPCIYQGEELALPEVEVPYERLVDPYGIEFWPDFKGRDGCRTPYPWSAGPQAGFSASHSVSSWLPIGDAHRALNFESQTERSESSLSCVRALIKTRGEHLALMRGSMTLCESASEVLVFERVTPTEVVRCLFNPTLADQVWESNKSDQTAPEAPAALSSQSGADTARSSSTESLLISSRGVTLSTDTARSRVTLPPQSWAWVYIGHATVVQERF